MGVRRHAASARAFTVGGDQYCSHEYPTRDPRSNVLSCHNLDFYGDLHQRPEFRARAFWMRWMPAVRRDDWDTLSPFERNCAFWTETHRLALTVGTHSHYRRVRMEDLQQVNLLRELFGPEIGEHAALAIGVAALPFNAPLEIEGEVELA